MPAGQVGEQVLIMLCSIVGLRQMNTHTRFFDSPSCFPMFPQNKFPIY
jgi:hypothetical protein